MKNLRIIILAACVAGFSLPFRAQAADQASEISETELSTGSSETDKEIRETPSGAEGTDARKSGTKAEPAASPAAGDKKSADDDK
jgi:hypothetical protein